jgi:hypothetical protein
MITLSLEARTLIALANRYAGAPLEIADLVARRADLFTRRILLPEAQATVHVVSGALKGSLRPEAAVPVGRGTLEARVEAGVPYADDEVSKGDAHAYPDIVVDATDREIQFATDALALDMVKILEGPL